jgi:hypothetical protein
MKTGRRSTSAIVARGCIRTPVTRRIKIPLVVKYEEGRSFVSSHPSKPLNTRDFCFKRRPGADRFGPIKKFISTIRMLQQPQMTWGRALVHLYDEWMRLAVFVAALSIFTVQPAFAQNPVGTRAQGMAGAYVGVADDASAVYWNPAGIASAPIVSVVAGIGAQQRIGDLTEATETQQHTNAIVAISATAIGAAYYRFTTYGVVTNKPEVSGPDSREEVGRSVHEVTTSTVGVSLLQSLTDHLVVGATPKFVHGAGAGTFDVDAGVMFSRGQVRLGLVARNLTTPAFATATAGGPEESEEIQLSREVRVGAAWGSGWTGVSRVIVSVDGDVTSRVTPEGDRRDVAAGVETWWLNQRLGLRAGARGSTIGAARAAFAAGVSAGLTPGLLLEAHVVGGHADERSWSVGARMLF